MTELVITPEISLQLQNAAREVGLSESELKAIISPQTLELLVPLIKQQAKLVFHKDIPVWQEIEITPNVTNGTDFINVLESAGVWDHYFAFDFIRSQLQLGVREPVLYELFKVTLVDLGIHEAISYDKVVNRARVLGIHDDSAPLSLITELILQGLVKAQTQRFKYHVCTKPVDTVWFGEKAQFAFALANGFHSEDPSDTRLKETDVLLLRNYVSPTPGRICPTEHLIFSRKKTSDRPVDHVFEVGQPPQ